MLCEKWRAGRVDCSAPAAAEVDGDIGNAYDADDLALLLLARLCLPSPWSACGKLAPFRVLTAAPAALLPKLEK